MKSFIDPYAVFFIKILDLLPKGQSLLIEYRIDAVRYFESKVTIFFEQHPFYEQKVLRGFQNLFQVRLNISKDGLDLASFGTNHNKDKAILLSQAELLERTSSWLPLDLARDHKFLSSSLFNLCDKKFFVKSYLHYGFKKRSGADIYWGLAKKTGTKRHVTTSGAAGHFDKGSAILNGWLELIERDSFLVYWLNTISPKHINFTLENLKNSNLKNLLQEMQSLGYEYYVLDITSDIEVPTCLTLVLLDTPSGKKIAVSSKSGFNGEELIMGALIESVVILESLGQKEPYILPKNFIPFSDERIDKSARVRLLLSEEGFSKSSFLISSKESISVEEFQNKTMHINSISQRLSYLKNIFESRFKTNKDYDVFIYTFRNKLIETFDFKVVRVLCDALYPMYLSEHFADPDHPRLYEFVKNKGLEKNFARNLWPHPFP